MSNLHNSKKKEKLYRLLPKMYRKNHIFRYLWKLPRRIYDRIFYGCCDIDTWAACDHISSVIVNTLEELIVEGHGYPGYGEYDTEEKWLNALRENAEKLRKSIHWEDWENPYEKDYEEMLDAKFGSGRFYFNEITEEEQKLTEAYYNKEKENHDEAAIMRTEALEFIIDNYDSLID